MNTKTFLSAIAVTLIAGNAVAQDAKTGAQGYFQGGTTVVTSLEGLATPRGISETCYDLNSTTPDGNTPSWDALDDTDNVVAVFNIGAGNELTGAAYDVQIESVGASWLSEATIQLSNSDGSADPNAIFVTPGVGEDAAGTMEFSSGGVVTFADIPLPNIVPNADGEIHVQFFESFDDSADAIDALHTNASTAATCFGLHLACTDQAACDEAMAPAPAEARAVPGLGTAGLVALALALMLGAVVVLRGRAA